MRCNPLRWLWGVAPIVALSLIAVLLEQAGIERDLKRRAEQALSADHLRWASVTFDGRDALLTGRAADERDPKEAAAAIRQIWGVRAVKERVHLIDKIDAYVWSASIKEGHLKLTGHVPTEAIRKAIVGVAKANFPKADVDDKMRLAHGAPARDTWLGGVSFGLKQLSGLRRGSVELKGTDLSISGEAEDAASYKSVKTALQASLPQGIRLAGEKVAPPLASPYLWTARSSGGGLLLGGYVPSEAMRREVLARARRSLPAAAITDRMMVADGAPPGWIEAVSASLDQLAKLDEAGAEMRDGALHVFGRARDEGTAEAVRHALKDGVPSPIKVSDNIKVSAVPARAATAPYTTKIVLSNGSLDLSGQVPSEAARAALKEALGARLAGVAVADRLEVKAGAPEGWQSCVLVGAIGIVRMGAGELVLSDRRLELTGETRDPALAESLPGDVQAGAGRVCDVAVKVSLVSPPAPPPPLETGAAVTVRSAEPGAWSAEAAQRIAAGRIEDEPRPESDRPSGERQGAQAEADKCQETMRSIATEGSIQFERASAVIDQRSLATLAELAKVASICPSAHIVIEGHTDAEGTPDRNLVLSQRRAQSVVEYLEQAGIEGWRLSAVGYGAERPIAPNDTPDNRAKNRRIEFAVKAD